MTYFICGAMASHCLIHTITKIIYKHKLDWKGQFLQHVQALCLHRPSPFLQETPGMPLDQASFVWTGKLRFPERSKKTVCVKELVTKAKLDPELFIVQSRDEIFGSEAPDSNLSFLTSVPVWIMSEFFKSTLGYRTSKRGTITVVGGKIG